MLGSVGSCGWVGFWRKLLFLRAAPRSGSGVRGILILPILVFSGLLLISCGGRGSGVSSGDELARVGEEVLYRHSLPADLDLGGADSAARLTAYVDSWVRSRLLYGHAKEALGGPVERIERQVNDYRARLYTDAYLEYEGLRSIDTAISESVLEEYYSRNSAYFTLSDPLVRVVFVRLGRESRYLEDLRSAMRALDLEGDSSLQEFSSLTVRAGVMPLFSLSEWVSLRAVERELPSSFSPGWNGRAARTVELEDGDVVYLLRFLDWLPAGSIKPIEAVRGELRNQVLRERLEAWRLGVEEQLVREHAQGLR